MMWNFIQLFGGGCCRANGHFFEKLPRVARDDFCAEMLCQVYAQSGLANACGANDGDKVFHSAKVLIFL